MDPVEKAIRNALAKGNAEDRAFREKVYRSAFAALERATASQPQLTVEMAIKRRQSLQARITSIESEYLPAAPALPVQPGEVPDIWFDLAGTPSAASAVEAPSVSVDGPPRVAPSIAPSIAVDREPPSAAAPAVDIEAGAGAQPLADDLPPADIVTPDRDERRARKRRPLAAAFVVITLLSAVAIGGWWAHEVGLLRIPSASEYMTAPPQIVEEDFDPAREGLADSTQPGGRELRNWISVFSPSDPSGVNAPTGATAEVSEDESGQFMRIRSGTTGAAVVFDVGQGILEEIAGKKAVFDISARSEDGTQAQISISCDFGEMGDCGRQRYAVGYERGEYLFDVELPGNRPGAAGSIAINSDFTNEGKAVDIYEIRVSVVE